MLKESNYVYCTRAEKISEEEDTKTDTEDVNTK